MSCTVASRGNHGGFNVVVFADGLQIASHTIVYIHDFALDFVEYPTLPPLDLYHHAHHEEARPGACRRATDILIRVLYVCLEIVRVQLLTNSQSHRRQPKECRTSTTVWIACMALVRLS